MNTAHPRIIATHDRAARSVRRLADSSAMVVWMSNAQGVCVYLNYDVAAMFDDIRDFCISDIAQFIHPEDVERLRPSFLAAKVNRIDYLLEYRLVRSDGSTRWMMAIGAPRFSTSHEFLGYIGTISDITVHREALHKLEKSEAELRLITENSGDMITHMDSTGVILYISPSCKVVTGFTPEELQGTNVYAQVHPDDIEPMQMKIRAQAKRSQAEGLVELRMRCKNGEYIWLEARASVLKDPTTLEKIGTVSIARDITSEKIAQNELRKREERFRGLTNLSSDWYWETDENDRFTYRSESSNADVRVRGAHCMGISRVDTALNPNDPQILEYVVKVSRQEPFRDIEYESDWGVPGLRRVDRISGEPIFEDGVFKGYRGVGRDATAEREAEAELARLAAENRALVENTLDIMAMLDQEGRFIRVNRAATDILGYAPEELLGRKYTEFLHPLQRESTVAVETALRLEGDGTIQNYETKWVHKSGKAVELSLSVRRDSSQQTMFATARDVTAANRTQTELRKSKDFLSTILESIGDAFFTLDRDWRAVYVNQKTARFIGFEQHELIGRILWEVVPHIVGTDLAAQYEKVMVTGEAAFFEAFWSASPSIPNSVKYAVGALGWTLVIGFFAFAGRGRQ